MPDKLQQEVGMSYMEDFAKIVKEQLDRVERMKEDTGATDFASKEKIIIGFQNIN